jgi:putative redox protein
MEARDPALNDDGTVHVREGAGGPYAQLVDTGGHQLIIDEPASVGGGDRGPAPYELLLAALGSCTSITLRMYADRKGWPLTGIDVELRHQRIHARDCEDCETTNGMLDHVDRVIRLDGDELTAEQRADLMRIADKCPVHRTLAGEVHIETRAGD